MLAEQPTTPTRKRKFLRPNAVAQWVLRLGDLRVFYDVASAAPGESADGETNVTVKAVGKKVHNQLWIGGERIDL